MRVLLFAAALLVGFVATVDAQSRDRHAGYYYPQPSSSEVYVSRAKVLIDSDRSKRLDFVNGLTSAQLSQPFRPSFAIFAKGDRGDRLIISALDKGHLDTVYRARALLAQMTAVSRGSPMFVDYGVDELFTFLDLLKLLGFVSLTIGDGDAFAHQIAIR
jgi:hypothetical protein